MLRRLQRVVVLLHIVDRIARRITHLFPDVRGLVRFLRWGRRPSPQEARSSGERCRGAFRHPCETAGRGDNSKFFGSLASCCAVAFCALPVCRRHNHQLIHMLDVPSAVAEFDCKPVEQFGMSRSLAHDSKVFRSFDNAGSEELVPHAVYGYARGERVGGADRPVRQGEPVVRLARFQSRQKVRSISLYAFGARPCKRRASARARRRAKAFPNSLVSDGRRLINGQAVYQEKRSHAESLDRRDPSD